MESSQSRSSPIIEGHYSAKYDVELTELARDTIEMGRLVEKQLMHAVSALVHGDLMLARQVADREEVVNQMEVAIDRRSNEILAMRQPTAGDLRFVLMVIKTVNDLERIGDEVTRVAQMTRSVDALTNTQTYDDIEDIGSRVQDLLNKALNALERTDDVAALELIQRDKKTDKKFRNTLKRLKKWMMEESDAIPDAVDVLWAIRSLERVGDRSCNICEHVVFCVQGEDIRHLDIDRIGQISSTDESSATIE